MRIYTSFFDNVNVLVSNNIEIVSVVGNPPEWFGGVRMMNVVPKPTTLNFRPETKKFCDGYIQGLESVDAKQFVKNLETMFGGRDVALCSHEYPGYCSHRHILAKWISQKTKYNVKEYSPDPPVEKKDLSHGYKQLSLF